MSEPIETPETEVAEDRGDTVAAEEKAEELTNPEAPDEEGLETDEERAEREEAEAAEEKKKRIRIPKARFDEAINKHRQREQALMAEIEKLRGQKQQDETAAGVKAYKDKIAELQDQYEELIVDGEKDKARAVRRQIEDMREELNEFRISEAAAKARQAAAEDTRYTSALAKVEAQYPQLNADGDQYDEEATNEVASLMKALMSSDSRLSRDKALEKAARYVLGAPSTKEKAPEGGSTRDIEARRKAAEAAKKQPAAMNALPGSRSADDAKSDLASMSYEAFNRLSEDDLKRLRGDSL